VPQQTPSLKRLLQILPRLPPAVCGVGDYALNLASALKHHHQVETQFLCAGTASPKPAPEILFPSERLPALSAQSLSDWLIRHRSDFDAILLHISIYGYHKRGLPFWLDRGLAQSRLDDASLPLTSMFHELYAGGPPTSSAFWLRPFQKAVVRRLARRSTHLRTNRAQYADWLSDLSGHPRSTIQVLPVFSNLGEPASVSNVSSRPPAMAMYAWGIHDGRSLSEALDAAAVLCRRFNLTTIHLIGQGGDKISPPNGLELQTYGYLPASAISEILSQCKMAYCPYQPLCLGKSGLLASFAAHGLAVITTGKTPELPDGLRDRVEVLHESFLDTATIPPLNALGTGLRQWYDSHSLLTHAQTLHSQLQFT
jgi:hypothetical protein